MKIKVKDIKIGDQIELNSGITDIVVGIKRTPRSNSYLDVKTTSDIFELNENFEVLLIHRPKNKNYVVVSKLPEEQREPFLKWLQNQTIPVIESEPKDAVCAYKTQYNIWLQYHFKK